MNRLLKLTVSLEPQPASQFSELVCISIACGTPFKRVSDLRSGCHSSTSRHTDHLSLFYFIQNFFDLTPILEFKAFILGGQMGESEVLSAYNEIGSSDFARVIQYSWLWDREERDQWER